MFVCHQDDVCENYIGSVYVDGYFCLRECGLCVFGKLCPVGFLVVCKCSSFLLQSIYMSSVDCDDDGYTERVRECESARVTTMLVLETGEVWFR